MDQDDGIDPELLISLVEIHPVVWDKTLSNYKDRNETKNAWREICIALKPDFEAWSDIQQNAFGKEVSKKWTNLRDSFRKSRNLENEGKRSMTGKRKRKYIFANQMQFLCKLDFLDENSSTTYSFDQEIDSFGNSLQEDGRENEDISFQSASVQLSADSLVQHPSTSGLTLYRPSYKRAYFNEELQTIKDTDRSDRSVEGGCSKMAFLQSLMPHLYKYNDSQFLEFQIGVLNVIQGINGKHQIP